MKSGGILGLIGGILALLGGAAGFLLSDVFGFLSGGFAAFTLSPEVDQFNSELQPKLHLFRIVFLVFPIVAIVGAVIAFKNGTLGGFLMAAASVGILWAFGIGMPSIICVLPLGIGALLAFQEGQKTSADEGQ